MATPTPTSVLAGRQIWSTPTSVEHPPHCTAFDLPEDGILVLNGTVTMTLATDAIFQPFCSDIATIDQNGTLPISDFEAPFISSVTPQIFVLGAMLVISWILVIILVITPRTSFVIGNGTGFMGGRAILGGSYGSSSVIGVGGRPWLQKVAALTVFVSLLIATINSFNLAASQYAQGYEDAVALTNGVVGSLEIRIIRVISETFLWLAQVQTLIRLFPRRKEKVIIKWTGFALILLDTVFTTLDNFVANAVGEGIRPPRQFTNVIPALAYLFELALSFVYFCSVVYYSLVKRRFSYYHEKMRNICVVALLSLMAIAIPVVFFVLDIAQPLVIGWGDYVRWVGAAAASVVVWEWVERIEALEREERKDGILGREIFDGDELLDSTDPVEFRWPRRRRRRGGSDGHGDGDESRRRRNDPDMTASSSSRNVSTLMMRVKSKARVPSHHHPSFPADQSNTVPVGRFTPSGFTLTNAPPHHVSPVPRSDTTSAASTIYAVYHHPSDGSSGHNHQSSTGIGSGLPADSGHRANVTPSSLSSKSPSPAAGTQRSGVLQRPRNVAQRYLHTHLSRRRGGIESTSSPAPNSFSAPSTPSSTSTAPSKRPSTFSSSRLLSRLRRPAPEPADELPLFVIRDGQDGSNKLIVEPKSREAEHADVAPAMHTQSIFPRSTIDNSSIGHPPSTPDNATQSTGALSGIPSYPLPSNASQRQDYPPPPFSTDTSLPVAHGSTPTLNGAATQDSNIDQRSHSAGTGSRNSRRSPASMPILQEVESAEQTQAAGHE